MPSGWIEAAAFQGGRSYQQDAVACLASRDGRTLIGVLSDGIGGHGNGHLASRLIVRTCAAALRDHVESRGGAADMPRLLEAAAQEANRAVAKTVGDFPETAGMGATLVAAAVVENRLFWCSIGDSHLSVYRKGRIKRLNEDHSLAGGLDSLAKIGVIDEGSASRSRQRSSLTSAVSGDQIPSIDCPEDGVAVADGEIVLLASDGVETLGADEMAAVCKGRRSKARGALCADVIGAIEARMTDDQDNVSIIAAFVGGG